MQGVAKQKKHAQVDGNGDDQRIAQTDKKVGSRQFMHRIGAGKAAPPYQYAKQNRETRTAGNKRCVADYMLA